METKAGHPRVRQLAPEPETRMSSTLGRVDYEDAFLLEVGATQGRSSEEWMREILERSPASLRLRLLSGWTALGLKLRVPGSAGSVLGWTIRDSGPDFVLLGADSHIGMPGELLLRRHDQALFFATLVRQDNAIARAMWTSVETGHLRTVRKILELAGQRVSG
jgi:hypothetical protein